MGEARGPDLPEGVREGHGPHCKCSGRLRPQGSEEVALRFQCHASHTLRVDLGEGQMSLRLGAGGRRGPWGFASRWLRRGRGCPERTWGCGLGGPLP